MIEFPIVCSVTSDRGLHPIWLHQQLIGSGDNEWVATCRAFCSSSRCSQLDCSARCMVASIAVKWYCLGVWVIPKAGIRLRVSTKQYFLDIMWLSTFFTDCTEELPQQNNSTLKVFYRVFLSLTFFFVVICLKFCPVSSSRTCSFKMSLSWVWKNRGCLWGTMLFWNEGSLQLLLLKELLS